MLDELNLIFLGRSVGCSAALMAASGYTLPTATPHQAVTWTAIVVALTGVYYLGMTMWRVCPRKGRAGEPELAYNNANPLHPRTETAYETVEEARDHPHLTTTAVYVYVYGWGVLMFVSMYCMAGLNEPSSCWWAVGMLTLSFDELISRQTPRVWVMTLSTLLWASSAALWWASSGVLAREQSVGGVMISVVIPVLSPFIFFSLRSIRIVSRDVRALCEVALPFMVLISLGVLVNSDWTDLFAVEGTMSDDQLAFSQSHARRVNATGLRKGNHSYLETPSHFNPNGTELPIVTLPAAYVNINRYLVLLGVPFIACGCALNLANSVLHGYVTEFICAFLLTLGAKFIMVHQKTDWTALVSLGAAGVCFVALVLLRRAL
jgi:hypothetical protein